MADGFIGSVGSLKNFATIVTLLFGDAFIADRGVRRKFGGIELRIARRLAGAEKNSRRLWFRPKARMSRLNSTCAGRGGSSLRAATSGASTAGARIRRTLCGRGNVMDANAGMHQT